MVVGIDDKYPARLTKRVKQRVLDLKHGGDSYFVVADPLSDVGFAHVVTRSSPGIEPENFPGTVLGIDVKGSDSIREKISKIDRQWWEDPANTDKLTVLSHIARTKGRITDIDAIFRALEMAPSDRERLRSTLRELDSKKLVDFGSDGVVSITGVGITTFKRASRDLDLFR